VERGVGKVDEAGGGFGDEMEIVAAEKDIDAVDNREDNICGGENA